MHLSVSKAHHNLYKICLKISTLNLIKCILESLNLHQHSISLVKVNLTISKEVEMCRNISVLFFSCCLLWLSIFVFPSRFWVSRGQEPCTFMYYLLLPPGIWKALNFVELNVISLLSCFLWFHPILNREKHYCLDPRIQDSVSLLYLSLSW